MSTITSSTHFILEALHKIARKINRIYEYGKENSDLLFVDNMIISGKFKKQFR